MGRRRDHHPRFDASLCPDPAACGRLLHPSLVATGMESCECCGANLAPRFTVKRTPFFTGTDEPRWSIRDEEKCGYPAILNGRRIPDAFRTQEEAQTLADELNAAIR